MKLPPGYVPGQGVKKATGYGGLGQKMLEKMGWEKGKGLGKNEHGIVEALDVKKKEDTAGVGANAGWDWTAKHWEEAYNSAIQVVDQMSTSGSETDDSSYAEEAAGPSARSLRTHRDGTLSTATAAELKLAKDLAKDPWGRFGGRQGKMERIRQQEAQHAALAAKKLGSPFPGTTSGVTDACPSSSTSTDTRLTETNETVEVAKKRKRNQETEATGSQSKRKAAQQPSAEPGTTAKAVELDTAATGSRGKKACKHNGDEPSARRGKKSRARDEEEAAAAALAAPTAAKKAKSGKGRDKEGPASQSQKQQSKAAAADDRMSSARAAFTPTPKTGWWGATYFVSAGLLGGMGEDDTSKHERRTFDEGDQEALYMDSHNNKSQGRRGLGKSSTMTIGGVKLPSEQVSGANVTKFSDDCDEVMADASAGLEDAAQEAAPAEANKKPVKAKWLKLCKPILKKAPKRRMKLKELWKAVRGQLKGEHAAEDCDWAAARQAFVSKLQSSHKVALQGKVVKWVTNEQ